MIPPQVAIIIPTYNHAAFLRKALDSLIAQDFAPWEAIIVNNLSQDNTVEVVASYQDTRIRLVDFANHGIIATSRNRGVAISSAPYIAFLDSDDAWYPTKLSRCVAFLEQGYDLVCHGEHWLGPGDKRRTVVYGPARRASYGSLLLEGNCLSTSAVVIRRDVFSAVGGFSEEAAFVTAEDYELWLKIAAVGARIGFIQDILGYYLIHEGNQSRAALRNMEAVMNVLNHHLARGARRAYPSSAISRRRALVYYDGARGLQRSGRFIEAWPYFMKAAATCPWIARLYAAMALNALHVSR